MLSWKLCQEQAGYIQSKAMKFQDPRIQDSFIHVGPSPLPMVMLVMSSLFLFLILIIVHNLEPYFYHGNNMICASNLLGYLRVLGKENEQKLGGPRPRLMVLASRAAGILGKGVWGIALGVARQQFNSSSFQC